MGQRINTIWFWAREEAEADQKKPGTPGYSERYPLGVIEGETKDGKTAYGSRVREYFG